MRFFVPKSFSWIFRFFLKHCSFLFLRLRQFITKQKNMVSYNRRPGCTAGTCIGVQLLRKISFFTCFDLSSNRQNTRWILHFAFRVLFFQPNWVIRQPKLKLPVVLMVVTAAFFSHLSFSTFWISKSFEKYSYSYSKFKKTWLRFHQKRANSEVILWNYIKNINFNYHNPKSKVLKV